jgi:hypothetical protein
MANDFIGGSKYEGKPNLAPKSAFISIYHNWFSLIHNIWYAQDFIPPSKRVSVVG